MLIREVWDAIVGIYWKCLLFHRWIYYRDVEYRDCDRCHRRQWLDYNIRQWKTTTKWKNTRDYLEGVLL